jgi:ankyrin repeat protein
MSKNVWNSFQVLLNVMFEESINELYQSIFRSACHWCNISLVRLLLEYTDIDPSADNNFAIRIASQSGRVDVVDRLLQEDRSVVDPSANNNYAIRYASRFGRVDVVDRLLQEDKDRSVVDPSADNNYAIRTASKYGHIDVVNRLLQEDMVDPSADNNVAIRLASRFGRVDVVDRLLHDTSERVNEYDKNLEAIRVASENGHVDVVYILWNGDEPGSMSEKDYLNIMTTTGLKIWLSCSELPPQ